jgi:AraC-like DNA-binding protein
VRSPIRRSPSRRIAVRIASVSWYVPAYSWLQIVRTRDGLAAIGAAAGFADQAHMTRHIRALTGASPAHWRRDPRVLDLCRVRLPVAGTSP